MYLFGASGHGKVIAEIAELQKLNIEGFIDDNQKINKILDYKIYHEIPHDAKDFFISIGDNRIRRQKYLENRDFRYITLMHPNSFISKSVFIDRGTVVMAGATINIDSQIGKQCIINTNASVDHDCVLGDYVHISPNVALAGGVTVSEGAHLGIGSSVIPGIKIGKWSVIGAGSVIIENVPDYAVVVGNPGKIIKFNQLLT